MELVPLIHWARERAKACWNTASTTILTIIRSLGFDLVDHGLQFLPHLPSLSNTARYSTSSARHLLDKLFAYVFLLKILQCVLTRCFSGLKEGALTPSCLHSTAAVTCDAAR